MVVQQPEDLTLGRVRVDDKKGQMHIMDVPPWYISESRRGLSNVIVFRNQENGDRKQIETDEEIEIIRQRFRTAETWD